MKKCDNIKTSRKNCLRDEKRYSRKTEDEPSISLINGNPTDHILNFKTNVNISEILDYELLFIII